MAKLREELRKLSSRRMKEIYREHEPQDMEIRLRSRRECSLRMEKGELRSQDVGNKHVQDYGSKMVIVGSDVEALYPSLEAFEVAEIVYQAVLESKVKFDNIDWLEACKYIALTSTAQ